MVPCYEVLVVSCCCTSDVDLYAQGTFQRWKSGNKETEHNNQENCSKIVFIVITVNIARTVISTVIVTLKYEHIVFEPNGCSV